MFIKSLSILNAKIETETLPFSKMKKISLHFLIFQETLFSIKSNFHTKNCVNLYNCQCYLAHPPKYSWMIKLMTSPIHFSLFIFSYDITRTFSNYTNMWVIMEDYYRNTLFFDYFIIIIFKLLLKLYNNIQWYFFP